MGRDRLEKLLSRLHQREPDASGHRNALRVELVARFRQQFPGAQGQVERTPSPKRPLFVKLAVAFVLLFGLGAASRAPAEYPVEVGQRIEIVAKHPAADWPKPQELQPVLQQLGRTRELELKARRTPDGAITLTIELWGFEVAQDSAEQLRSAFPALRDAQITVTPLAGTARGNLGEKIGAALFHLRGDPASIEAAKRELQAKLRALGRDGTVDLQVEEGPNGKRRVLLKVEATQQAPAAPTAGDEAQGSVLPDLPQEKK